MQPKVFRRPAAEAATAMIAIKVSFLSGGYQTGKPANEDLKTGAGFEGTVAYRFMPHLGVYA